MAWSPLEKEGGPWLLDLSGNWSISSADSLIAPREPLMRSGRETREQRRAMICFIFPGRRETDGRAAAARSCMPACTHCAHTDLGSKPHRSTPVRTVTCSGQRRRGQTSGRDLQGLHALLQLQMITFGICESWVCQLPNPHHPCHFHMLLAVFYCFFWDKVDTYLTQTALLTNIQPVVAELRLVYCCQYSR